MPGFDSLGLTVTYVLVFVLSTLGNGLVVWVLCWTAKWRSSTDIFLAHLALADLLFGLTLPFWAVDVHSGWVFGTVMCKMLSGCQEASAFSGVFLLACISVDRHLAIVKATRVHRPNGPVLKATCATVWLLAALLSVPSLVQKQQMETEDPERHICYENLSGDSGERWRLLMCMLRHLLGFFLPLAVMVVCYGSALARLLHTHNRQKQKAIGVILAVVLAFIVCWLPYNLLLLTELLIRSSWVEVATCGSRYRVEVAFSITKLLAFLHCAVNPLLYAFIGVKFRKQLLTVCQRWSCSRSWLLRRSSGSSGNSGNSAPSRKAFDTLLD